MVGRWSARHSPLRQTFVSEKNPDCLLIAMIILMTWIIPQKFLKETWLSVKNSCIFFFFLVFCVDFQLKCSRLELGPIQKENSFLGFPPSTFFFFFFLIREKKITVRSFYFCSIKGNEAQKVSCNKDLRKNSLKSGYCLQRHLQKTGSSSVWHLVLFGKTKREAGCSTALFT